MLSVRPVAIDRRASPTDFVTISYRIIFQGKSRHKKSIHKIPLNYWDGERVKKGYPNHTGINAELQAEAARILQDLTDINRDRGLSLPLIDEYLTGQKTDRIDIIQFVTDYGNKQLKLKKKSPNTTKNYTKYTNKLKEFTGTDKVYFDQINTKFLEDYEARCIEQGNSPFTIWDVTTKFLCKFLKLAKYPTKFDGYDWPRPPKEGSKVYLTMKELDKLEKVKLNGTEAIVRDYFLLGCYSGLRFSDWNRYEIESIVSGPALKVRAEKNKEPVYLSLEKRPRLKAVIDRLVPIELNMVYTNRLLKLIALRAKIDKNISTHVGRHTAATMHAELGYSREFVAQLLGVTVSSVEYYYKVTRRKLRNEEELFGGL